MKSCHTFYSFGFYTEPGAWRAGFRYRNVLSQELGPVDLVRAKPSQHMPTVLSRADDRYTVLPTSLLEPLHDHLMQVKRIHIEDLSKGYGAVYSPFALAEKCAAANIDGSVNDAL